MTVEPLAPPNLMTYDGENRMTAFQGGGAAAGYSYDGNGILSNQLQKIFP